VATGDAAAAAAAALDAAELCRDIDQLDDALRQWAAIIRTGGAAMYGRGLHSSISQLNLSHSWSQKPQQMFTAQLNLMTPLSLTSPKMVHKSAHVLPKSGSI
jgi:hypothetical protein